jgi:hypothetical protein
LHARHAVRRLPNVPPLASGGVKVRDVVMPTAATVRGMRSEGHPSVPIRLRALFTRMHDASTVAAHNVKDALQQPY